MNRSPTIEERVWGVLSHLSALAFGLGILIPILGWSEQRRKSRYIAFQCLQALGFQSLGFTVWLLLNMLLTVVAFLVFAIGVGSTANERGSSPLVSTGFMIAAGCVLVGVALMYLILPALAALACVFEKDFRYPILGVRLAKYLNYEYGNEAQPLNDEHEERWVVAMGHFSVIILVWGMLAPLVTWGTQGKRTHFLKFQSMQAILFQAIVTIVSLGAIFVLMLGVSAMLTVTGLGGNSENSSLVGIIVFLVFSSIGAGILFVIPLFHILGQWAGYRILKGDDYHYPIVGKLVKKWMANQTLLVAEQALHLKGEAI
jgi:uncharacterized Tic20 family protein